MIKKLLFLFPLLIILISGCKKQDKPDAVFTLTSTLRSSNTVVLNWTATNLTGFKNVSIYRSTQPIPDPTFDKPIDGNLQIGVVNDNTITTFSDSTITIGTNGKVYYKVVLNLADRFITSNQVATDLNAFALILPSTPNFIGTNFIVKQIPELNIMYVFDFSFGLISAVDYSQKKIVATTNFSTSNFSSNLIYTCINNNQPEIFMYSNNGSIICYNGLTLAQKYSFSINSSFYDFKVKDGYLYELVYNVNGYWIYTYSLSNFSLINQTSLPYGASLNGNVISLFVSNQSSNLFLKYYTQLYSSQTGQYNYTNKLVSYNIANGAPTSITNLNIAAINPDTTNGNNVTNNAFIQVSPNGKYVACNRAGDVYSMIDNSVHNVNFLNPTNPLYVFSNNSNFMLSKLSVSNNVGQLIDKLEIYGLPNFNLATTQSNQGSNSTSVFVLDEFIDNDTLLSYNIARDFINNQSVNTITVLFKKVD